MADHKSKAVTTNYVAILRSWREIDPKVIVGAASSVTVGAIVSAGSAVGWDVPTWLAAAIVIAVYFVASYWTKTKIPVADDSGLTAQQAAIAVGATSVGVELSEDDVKGAIREAFKTAGVALDENDEVIDKSHPLIAGDEQPPAQNTLAP